ncbi:MAG: tyrosine-type recombinase/integrase [Planctomycetes bacterium]|nr:tyrosine-type recombinase/integrase [Planctomycetota bacterium]
MSYTFRREPLRAGNVDPLANACESFEEKLVVWTLLDTGVRVSEYCNLRPENVEWQFERIVVYGKGGPFGSKSKRRVVPMTPRVRKLLEVRFVTHRGIGMTQRTVKWVAARAGIVQHTTPLVIRHTLEQRTLTAQLDWYTGIGFRHGV